MLVIPAKSKFAKAINVLPIASLLKCAKAFNKQVLATLLELLLDTDLARYIKVRLQIGFFTKHTVVEVDFFFVSEAAG